MRSIAITLSLFALLVCKESPYITAKEIAALTQKKPDKLVSKKAYNVHGDRRLENVIQFEAGARSFVGAFARQETSYSLLRLIELPAGSKVLKLIFINPGLAYSHMLLILKKNDGASLLLADAADFRQEIAVDAEELKSMVIRKIDASAGDECIEVGEVLYRFDSLRYLETFEDRPHPFLDSLVVSKSNSMIRLRNRGGYTGRAVITLSFPDLGGGYRKQVKLTKNIPTVKMYRPGQRVHRAGGGRMSLKKATIEIIKEPFGKMAVMQLPLFLGDSVGKIYLRLVYKYRGGVFEWPPEGTEGSEKDQQGYPAYVLNAPQSR